MLPHMGVLLVTCPVTGKEYSTGVQIARESNIAGMLDVEAAARCPYCQAEHKWRPRDARYAEALPPSDWVENR